MIYFIKTRQISEICYAIHADENLTPEEFLNVVMNNPMSKFDFSQKYKGEEIDTFATVTKEEYLKIFDDTYPEFKSINKAQKLFNIREFPGEEVIQHEILNERDEL